MHSQRPCLVEAPLSVLGPVQRHRDNQHFWRRLARQLGNGLGQHPAQPVGCRMELVVLEGVNGGFHAAFVDSEGHGPCKAGRREAARAAQRGAKMGRIRRGESVAATTAQSTGQGGKFHPAGIADWRRREMRQRGAAEGTDGRKEGATKCIHGTSKYARHGAPTGSL